MALFHLTFLSIFTLLPFALAEVTVYTTQIPTSTSAAPGAAYTGFQAYDPGTLQPPPLPNPLPNLNFDITLPQGGVPGLSKQQNGNFLGLSIELSLAAAVLGPTGDVIFPEFLNLMSTLKQRSGSPVVRVGGNTQEKAVLLDADFLPDGKTLEKALTGATGVTQTPTVTFTMEIMYALGNITQLLDMKWFLGIPFNDTVNPRLRIAEVAEAILGDSVVSYQLGNEPDLYAFHGYRATYDIPTYFGEFQSMITSIGNDAAIPRKNMLGGPGICCIWNVADVLNQGYLQNFHEALNTFIIEHYPYDNCIPGQHNPQNMMDLYMVHSFAEQFANNYVASVTAASQYNLPVVLLETNTASCGGFLGLSDAFAATLWATDLAMQLASINFSNMMVHVGGQHVYYNPFVPPPANESKWHQWTVGPVFYANLIVAEALGSTGTAQVVDLKANNGDNHTPAYAIYEEGAPMRLLLLNYMTDASGAAAYTVQVSTGGNLPQVWVRYLSAPSVAWKGNITLAGQTFGGQFQSNGTLYGTDDTKVITCQNNVCAVPVQAPEIALVFFSQQALQESGVGPQSEAAPMYTTTVFPHQEITVTVPQQVLETSNGRGGLSYNVFGSTSKGGGLLDVESAADPRAAVGWMSALVVPILVMLGMMLVR